MNTTTTRKLFQWILGSAIAIIILLAVVNKLDLISILTNIFSELIGIIVTVFLIEKILSEHEKKSWENVKHEIDRKINGFAMKTFLDMLSILDLKDKVDIDIEKTVSKGIASYGLLLTVEPGLLEGNYFTDEMYINGLKKLVNDENIHELVFHTSLIKQAVTDGYKIMDLFREQFSPDLYAHLIQTVEKLERLSNFLELNLGKTITSFKSTRDNSFLHQIAYEYFIPIISLIDLFNMTIYHVTEVDE